MKHLIMLGAGGLGRETYWFAKDSIGFGTEFDLKGYLDNAPPEKLRTDLLQMPLLGTPDSYEIEPDDVFICEIVDAKSRYQVINQIQNRIQACRGGRYEDSFINLIHKTAMVESTAKLGIGVTICPNAIVGDNAIIGNHVRVAINTLCAHDVIVGDYSSLMNRSVLAGYVEVGQVCSVATGAILITHSKVEDNAYVGAGSVVLKKVKEGKKVFGVPAREIPNIF